MHTYIFTLKLYYLSLSSLHTYVWLTVYRSDGFEQAKLGPSSLNILVDKETDKELMKDDMTKLNPSFLERFPLTIQKGTLIKQNTGGFLKATGNDKKKNNSTCGHVVPKWNKVVYTKGRNALKKYKSDTEQEMKGQKM